MACGDNSAHLVDLVDVVDVDANISGTDTLNDAGPLHSTSSVGDHDSSDIIDNTGDGSGDDSDSWELDLPQYLPWITEDVRFTQRMQAYSRILGVPLPYAGSQSTETVHHPEDDDQSHNCNNDIIPDEEDQHGNVTENNDDADIGNQSEESESETSETSDNIENHLDDEHDINDDDDERNEADEAFHDGNDDDGYEHSLNLSDISTTTSMGDRFFVDSETESSVDGSSQCKRRRL